MEITAENAKELIGYLGIDTSKLKDVEEFKTQFDTSFIKPSAITEDYEPVKKIVGKIYGTLESEIKKVAKAFEVDVDFEEIKDKKVTDKLRFAVGKINEKSEGLINELKANQGKAPEELVKAWEEKVQNAEKKVKEKDVLLKGVKEEFDGFKQEHEKFKLSKDAEIKQTKIDIAKKAVFAKAKFATGIHPLAQDGFFSKFSSKYKIDLDEKDTPFITDAEGNKLLSKKVAGEYKNPDELLEEELIAEGLIGLNPKGGLPKPAVVNLKTPADLNPNPANKRTLGKRIA